MNSEENYLSENNFSNHCSAAAVISLKKKKKKKISSYFIQWPDNNAPNFCSPALYHSRELHSHILNADSRYSSLSDNERS